MHFQHSCIVFGELGADQHDEIDILSTILLLVQNHSKSCPEMMKIIVDIENHQGTRAAL